MPDFHRTNVTDTSFIRGAARILIAPTSVAFPVKIDDVIDLGTPVGPPIVPATYDATDRLGRSRCHQDRHPDHDQQRGRDVRHRPGARRHRFSADKLGVLSRNAARGVHSGEDADRLGGLGDHDRRTPTTGSEKEIGFGQPVGYTQRRLAVLFQRPNGKIRGYFFRKVQRMPQESSITHAKTGEQISIPVRFKALPTRRSTDI
jgi:hypothetical protein